VKKIVINKCFGGFGYSDEAQKKYGLPEYDFHCERDNPNLIKAVEEMGQDVNSRFSELKIVEIPDDVEWGIDEYDGLESVAEVHRTWE